MASIAERQELAKLCTSRDWSKAIRILDSLLSQSCSIQDICNRAFCYSQLELHKHVIKDCDKALQMDPTLLQAYILKGRSLSALGKKDDALLVWEQGYGNAVRQSADLKQLLELEELLAGAKQNKTIICDDHAMESSSITTSASDSGSEIHSKSINGHEIRRKSRDDLAMESSSITTSASDSGSEVHRKSTDRREIRSKSRDTAEIRNKSSNGAIINKKVFVTSTSKTKSISLDFRLSRGIAQVNDGRYDHAISIFDQILRENPTSPEALIGRGTAYAFQRELDAAIADFTKAIESNPLAGEAWKRRGQARAALGESVEAIEDLAKALEFEPNSSDILHERGIVNFKFKDYTAAVEDLSSCVMLDRDNKSAYTYLGLALSSIGEYKRAEEAHMKSIRLDPNFLEGWTHLAQFYQDLANTAKALECLQQVLLIDERCAKAYHLRGLLHHGMGKHRDAIKDLSVGLGVESSNIECLYLRASCYHAIGEYGEAVKDYDALLDLELDSMEKFVLQCLGFYQKEIALYTASKINSEFCWFDLDGDIDPLFKEYWCKRLHPKYVCEKVYRQPPLRESLKKGRLRKQDVIVTKQKATLLQAADLIGKKIQYNCKGFMPNRRQHRMAGLAAIEIAQKVSKAWRALQLDWKISSKNATKTGKKARKKEKLSVQSHNRGGACCSTSSSSEPSTSYNSSEDKSASSRFMLSWREVYSLAVKWRQISEPCDSVVWINKLSEEFNSGFGSHTPMVLGQANVVRYFPNYQRTLSVAKTIIGERMYVNKAKGGITFLSEDGKLQNIMRAESCSDLHSGVGEDFWVATTCNSTAFEGKHLEGTRITVQKTAERGFDFAIRTPCTPSRWDDYDAEMTIAWEALCNAYCGEVYGSTDLNVLESVRDAILRMAYYWYNFMPLSRGSAAVGYVVLLGLFLAANMEVTESIPKGVQVDWEAILSPDPSVFVDSIKSWLYPSLKIKTLWKDYPDVASTFATTASIVSALSTYND
ncbi:suppressor of RPS4-RLD 1 isoform X1 [Magnolia sinica]|uniref:suppressor of RPS4-RLD 1 isoform X1 n=1 Tax=Magnolia sinica TaxID=86752 RepID=UPI00265A7911|nr:suppressor of RPS4-RLD 1 isoform X1 [Magnolia sinica]XP_058069964.1 suppressor of RPS4-RLD 1 isoform X1 [Magnolia sinica]